MRIELKDRVILKFSHVKLSKSDQEKSGMLVDVSNRLPENLIIGTLSNNLTFNPHLKTDVQVN